MITDEEGQLSLTSELHAVECISLSKQRRTSCRYLPLQATAICKFGFEPRNCLRIVAAEVLTGWLGFVKASGILMDWKVLLIRPK